MTSVLSRLSLVNRDPVLIEPFYSAINVKTYGAKGDGVTPDGVAIQAALDAAYGSASSPHAETNAALNKIVWFPAGTYLVDQQLFINYGFGACLIGAGSKATKLVYTGPDSKLSTTAITALMTAWSMQYSHIQGISFDVTGSNANVCFVLQSFAPTFTGKIDDGLGSISSAFWAGAVATNAQFIGTITGGVNLAVSGVTGAIAVGQELFVVGADTGVHIASGSNPNWVLNAATTNVSGVAMTTALADAILVTDAGFSAADGEAITFIAALTNTGAATLKPSGFGGSPIPVLKVGSVALTGGEVGSGGEYGVVYRSSDSSFHLSNVLTVTGGLTGKIFTSPTAFLINPATDGYVSTAQFTGTITSTMNLAVSGVSGAIRVGDGLSVGGVDTGVTIASGSNPNWVLSGATTNIGPVAMTTTAQNWVTSQLTSTTYQVANSMLAPSQVMAAQVHNDGTGNLYLDCAFIGGGTGDSVSGTGAGFLTYGGSGQLGSEEQFRNCLFDTCAGFGGLRVVTGNALDYSIINCVFQSCTVGINVPVGSVNLVQGCRFHSNSAVDIFIKQGQSPAIVACQSDSDNFLAIGPAWVAGCYHTGSSTFWSDAIPSKGLDYEIASIDGCYATASGLTGNRSGTKIYLRGNTFDSAGYLTNISSGSGNHGAAFSGTISNGAGGAGTQLDVTGLTGFIVTGEHLLGTGVVAGTAINSDVVPYSVTVSQHVGPVSMTAGGVVENI